jgi:beta-lactamase superfamily II metal-dependent hydrolase
MTTKATSKVKRAKTSSSTRQSPIRSLAPTNVKVRMYRQGLGDCFLVTLPRNNDKPFYILIDCGVILGTQDAVAKMRNVVNDIIKTTDGHIDVLLATHEHWDHLSGFVQARELFEQIEIDNVWFGWTEDPEDKLAQKLRLKHQEQRIALTKASARIRLEGHGNSIVDGMLEFFGSRGQGTTADALEIVRKLGQKNGGPRYCLPEDKPVDLPGTGARAFVLGPPYNETALKRSNPYKSNPETYGLAEDSFFLKAFTPTINENDSGAPFDPIRQIPLDLARQLPFFQNHYWGANTDLSNSLDQSWRRIDTDWLDISTNLALQLDSYTNNTSLVVALEMPNRDVLLFASDAQVGNWLSWQDLTWETNSGTATGPDLLRRTVFYKVGHHGSHNSTLREKGLEQMSNLKIACLPVDQEMAKKKRWGKMPLDELETELNKKTQGRVLRIDRPIPAALSSVVRADEANELYYEVEIPC